MDKWLATLPPTNMQMDSWKRLYSNSPANNFRKVAIDGLWSGGAVPNSPSNEVCPLTYLVITIIIVIALSTPRYLHHAINCVLSVPECASSIFNHNKMLPLFFLCLSLFVCRGRRYALQE